MERAAATADHNVRIPLGPSLHSIAHCPRCAIPRWPHFKENSAKGIDAGVIHQVTEGRQPLPGRVAAGRKGTS